MHRDPRDGEHDEHARRALEFRRELAHLASISRPSASDGEREAAEYIAARLGELGARAEVDQERAHGGYWWPIGLLNGAAAVSALVAKRSESKAVRAASALVAGVAAAALWDDVSGGSQWFRRALLPRRPTWNVVGEIGASSEEAERTLVLIAHHDSAHSGLVFHPAISRVFPDHFPEAHSRATQSFPIMTLTWTGSVLAGAGALLGSRRTLATSLAFSLGTIAAMTDIGLRDTVPGANDNLSAVAVLFAIARSLADDPPPAGTRVILVSTGSEESFMEGMRGFAARHFADFDPDRTEMLCLECLGGPDLLVLEGEGMLRMRDYPGGSREALAAAAARAGVEVIRGLRTVAATDALIALRAGFSVSQLASVDYTKFPANYHWPTDTPENLVWSTIGEAIAVADEFVRAGSRVAA